jgi:hypothetical protein
VRKESGLIIAFALAVAGCARTPFPVIDSKLDELKGQPSQSVSDKHGDPNEKAQNGGEKSYIWNLTSDYGALFHSVGFACTITVFADKDDKVSRYTYDGNVGGCGQYAHKLDDDYHSLHNILD